jgi:hypothetical protein
VNLHYELSCNMMNVWRYGLVPIDWAQLSKLLPDHGGKSPVSEKSFLNKIGPWLMSKEVNNCICYFGYDCTHRKHQQSPLDI